MDDRTEAREVKRLFAGGIAAADHDERLVAERGQRTVARRAVSHALGFQLMFARHAEMLVARAGGDDDGFCNDFFAVHDEREWPPGKIHGLDHAKLRPRAKTLGLLLHSRHQFITVHAFGEAGEIFHDAGGGEQAAGLLAGEHQRRELRAGRVKRRRPARRS